MLKPKFPPSILLHRPTGQARIRWKKRDYYLGPYGSAEAQERYSRLVAEIAAGGLPGNDQPWRTATVGDVAAAWLESAEQIRGAGSKELGLCRLALAPLLALYETTPAKEFRVRQLEAVQLAMATGSWMSEELKAQRGKRHAIGWCRRVVNRHVTRIRTVWRWAERHDLVPTGSWEHLRTLGGVPETDRRFRGSGKRVLPSFADVLTVAKQCPPVVRSMLLLQWWSGMRSAEVRMMRVGEIDRSGPVWFYRPRTHKNAWRGQDRVVPLGPKCQALLRPWMLGRDPEAVVFPPSRRRRAGNVAYHDWGYAQAVRRAGERVGVKLQPYDCRHAAKQRITRVLGLDAARAVLGQASIGTTNAYGAQQDLGLAAEAMRRLG